MPIQEAIKNTCDTIARFAELSKNEKSPTRELDVSIVVETAKGLQALLKRQARGVIEV